MLYEKKRKIREALEGQFSFVKLFAFFFLMILGMFQRENRFQLSSGTKKLLSVKKLTLKMKLLLVCI